MNHAPLALLALLLALAPAAYGQAGGGEGDPEARCRDQMTAVRAGLERRDDLRDEAYTAIMWARLDAEAALADGRPEQCLRELDFPRRALGIHEESTTPP